MVSWWQKRGASIAKPAYYNNNVEKARGEQQRNDTWRRPRDSKHQRQKDLGGCFCSAQGRNTSRAFLPVCIHVCTCWPDIALPGNKKISSRERGTRGDSSRHSAATSTAIRLRKIELARIRETRGGGCAHAPAYIPPPPAATSNSMPGYTRARAVLDASMIANAFFLQLWLCLSLFLSPPPRLHNCTGFLLARRLFSRKKGGKPNKTNSNFLSLVARQSLVHITPVWETLIKNRLSAFCFGECYAMRVNNKTGICERWSVFTSTRYFLSRSSTTLIIWCLCVCN